MNAAPPKTVLRSRRGSTPGSGAASPAPQPAALPTQSGFTVCIEGNIAAGKTRLITELERQGGQPVYEPVDRWQQVVPGADTNLLGRMYEDPARWAYLFQSWVLLTMMEAHDTPQTAPVRVMERSVLSARWCFIENLRKSDPPMIDAMEYEVYSRWFSWLMEARPPQIDLIVYLRTTPDVCMHRLHKRARAEEAWVTPEYLGTLHARYEEWLMAEPAPGAVPVLVLDANADDGASADLHASYCAQIDAKLQSLRADTAARDMVEVASALSSVATPPGKLVGDTRLLAPNRGSPATTRSTPLDIGSPMAELATFGPSSSAEPPLEKEHTASRTLLTPTPTTSVRRILDLPATGTDSVNGVEVKAAPQTAS